MESSKLSFKLFAQEFAGPIEQFVPVFHSWIQTHAIADHLLIDVADYAHVHNGPGIVLVAHEANYSFDLRDGRPGLTYQRKRPLPGSLADRIRAAFDATLAAARLLSEHVRFRADEIEFRVCDRLHAPNTAETFELLKPQLLRLFPDARLTRNEDPLELFTVTIRPAQPIQIPSAAAATAPG
ncbi:hypothetical protein [Fontivita pretiosa]|uniref:hypothetical protein n=1 Tax=Fontivita pretiosa TaxID=2989684 RepID=UPI003D180836